MTEIKVPTGSELRALMPDPEQVLRKALLQLQGGMTYAAESGRTKDSYYFTKHELAVDPSLPQKLIAKLKNKELSLTIIDDRLGMNQGRRGVLVDWEIDPDKVKEALKT